MSRLRRYYTAFNRYRRSKGFGIHSPFAFSFVRLVLRERYPYYAYADIAVRRRRAIALASSVARHPRVISLKNAKMLFRVVCRFSPTVMFQCGTSYGVSTSVMLDADSRSRLVIYAGENAHENIYDCITADYRGRIDRYPTLSEAVEAYFSALGDNPPFVLINAVTEVESALVGRFLLQVADRQGVIVMRNIAREGMRALWLDTVSSLPHGMSFTNDRIGFIVAYRHLPRQNFSLWF